MKSPLLLLGAACAVLACSSATARIGETLEECETRYGKAVSSVVGIPEGVPDVAMHRFEKAGLEIYVTIFESKAVEMSFQKMEKDELGRPHTLSDAEIKTLLEASSQGEKWDTSPPEWLSANVEGWYAKADGQVILAHYNTQKRHLGLTTREFAAIRSKYEAKREKANLEGF